jgi:hypothetical protein
MRNHVSRRVFDMTRWTLAVCAIGSLLACDTSTPGTYTVGSVVRPDVAVSVQIAPETFFVGTPGAFACPGGVFSPAFALVITPFGAARPLVDSATFRLIDGSTVGGPSITFPRPELTRMFGTLVIAQRRTFAFSPAFGCPAAWPRAMTADVVMSDGQRFTASMALR